MEDTEPAPAAKRTVVRFLQSGRIVLADLADHVVKHDGDLELFWHGELQSLCSSCHSQRKQSVERRGYDRYSVDADGNPTDPLHPFNKKRL